ncbi:hypothetical protein LGH82_17485 [Mesorhizobium sp. PAMC28654]|uniref:hypothetical protein n=1 Tax=Mesorhizobium sp. PAMC28654 TaxID=2880934 RepID=UPI001D0BB20A|nr:hypothetical protein [Mesorhizobium sp. PAMC28654]UDL87011.1 hypothetical protein LGH82_17485 [Mesorhizobium sp. PAMC28654]
MTYQRFCKGVGRALFRKIVENFRRIKSIQKLINFRDSVFYHQFRLSGVARGRAFAETLKPHNGQSYCFTIAFNTPWVIDVITKAWLTFPTGMTLVVVDNSSKPAASTAIEEICRERDIPYFRLPRNFERNPSRSHGVSQNWVFHNIVKHLKPDVFGFIDHDCFPIGPINIAERIVGKAGYGLPLPARSTYLYKSQQDERSWFYWAGLCFFRFVRVEHLNLDFRTRLDLGMDTGGGNWPLLYSMPSADEFEMARQEFLPIDVGGEAAIFQIFDGALLHIGGASYNRLKKEAEYRRLLSDHIWTTYLGGIQDRISRV